MPPKKQNQRSLDEIEMGEMRPQIQLLQETVNAQEAILEAQRRRVQYDGSGGDSSFSRSHCLHRCQPRMNDIKVDIPDLERELQPDEFVDWLQAIEPIFEYKDSPEEHKVNIVAVKLKKHALIWWGNLKRKRKCEGKSKIKTWEKMRQKQTRKYLPPPYYQEYFTQLQLSETSSYQPLSSTKNYIDYHIALDCVNHKVFTIVNGEINNIFEEEKEDTHELLEDKTMREPIYDEEYVGVDFRDVFEEKVKEDLIYDDEFVPNDIHEVFEKEDKNEPIYDEEYVPIEYGESLKVKESLQTTTDKEESCIKHNIFNTSNTSEEKVCGIIIDSRSFENVVSNNMVEKSKLPTKEPPHPYNLPCLNKDNEDVIEIKLAPLLLNEFNEGEEEFKPVGLLVAKEIFKKKTK